MSSSRPGLTVTEKQGVTWFGVTWFVPHYMVIASVAVLAVIAMMLPGIDPAGAKGKPSSGSDSATPTSEPTFSNACGKPDTVFIDDVVEMIGAEAAHESDIEGEGIDIAVIDTGVSAVPGLDGRDKLVDGPDLSFDGSNENLRHEDLHGHGTNMASIIASKGVAFGGGIAPEARIVDVKVGAADGTVDTSQVIAAIDWVVANKAANGMNIRVINLAYDTDADADYQSDPLSFAVENAWNNGIVVVAAGGNDGRGVHRLGNPALNPFIIAVGAVNAAGRVPSWSSTGDGVRNPDVVAPGAKILGANVPGSYLATTYPDAVCTRNNGSTYLRGSGTSQSAAVVSGAVALLLSDRPELTPNQVKALLISTATPSNASEAISGNGLINVAGALASPAPADRPQNFVPSNGLGTLDASRGGAIVGEPGDELTGEMTAFGGVWNSAAHAAATAAGTTWTDQAWSRKGWLGGTWSGATWSGATWSGATWSGATWSGATWSGATWSGATWSGVTWSGATWSGATWSGATWSGATWSGATWN